MTEQPTSDLAPRPPHIPAIAPEDHTVAIYLAALRYPRLRAENLTAEGFSPEEIDDAMKELVEQGLASPTGNRRWQMTPPEVSLPSLAAQHEERARSLRQSTPALARLYAEGQQSGVLPLGGAEALTSVVAVDAAVQQVIAGAAKTVYLVHRNSPYLTSLLDAGPERYARRLVNGLGQSVQARVVFDADLLADDRLHTVIQARADAGDDQRSSRSLPFSAYVNDTGTAVLDLEGDQGTTVGLMLTGRASARAIERFAEWVWRLSVRWRTDGRPDRDPYPLEPRDQEILKLLAAGASDSTVARQLRISQRTVERRVRAILDRLNAVNRFQAGVIAARRGLL